jgi:hypothetical protein
MKSDLTTEEYILFWDATLGQINAQFELWLTITFAVIVASYIAGHRLPKLLQYLVASLYSLTSILLFLTVVAIARRAGEYNILGLFAEDPGALTWVIAPLRLGVWILGTVTTVIFIFKGNLAVDKDPDSDTQPKF